MTKINKFAIVFIKPDAIKDRLIEPIISEFRESGFELVFSKPLNLTQEEATIIYDDHIDNPNYKYAIDSLLEEDDCKTCLFLLLKRADGNAINIAKETKGRADQSGIRAKYRRYLWTELKEKGIEGELLQKMLSRNRVHVPDSEVLIRKIIKLLLNEKEIKNILQIDPELSEFIDVNNQENLEKSRIKGKERI
jgi:nucleoside diphosphate kinase